MPRISDLPTDTAPDVADLVPFVDVTASRTEAVTVADLAASTAFSAAYQPLAAERLWVPANLFVTTNGTPIIGSTGSATSSTRRATALLFDASSAEDAAGWICVPNGWSTYNAFLWWTNAGAGSGDVFWRIQAATVSAAETSDQDGVTLTNTTHTAAAQYITTRTALATGTAVAAGDLIKIFVRRVATDVGDTLGNDAGLIGFEFVRAS